MRIVAAAVYQDNTLHHPCGRQLLFMLSPLIGSVKLSITCHVGHPVQPQLAKRVNQSDGMMPNDLDYVQDGEIRDY